MVAGLSRSSRLNLFFTCRHETTSCDSASVLCQFDLFKKQSARRKAQGARRKAQGARRKAQAASSKQKAARSSSKIKQPASSNQQPASRNQQPARSNSRSKQQAAQLVRCLVLHLPSVALPMKQYLPDQREIAPEYPQPFVEDSVNFIYESTMWKLRFCNGKKRDSSIQNEDSIETHLVCSAVHRSAGVRFVYDADVTVDSPSLTARPS